VNCRRVQDLLSPYVDERLTGQQMLEVRSHLDSCRSCAHEYMMQRQVKILLRSAAMKNPGLYFEARLRSQLAAERQAARLSLSMPAFSLTNRGRRMAYAMAFSCVSIFSLAHATSSHMAISSMAIRPALDAQAPPAILTDLQGENITTAFRERSNTPVQSGFFAFPRREHPIHRSFNFVPSFSMPVVAFPSSSVTLAGYPTH